MKFRMLIIFAFFCSQGIINGQIKLSVYKFLPGQDGFDDLYQDNHCKVGDLGKDDVDSLVFYIFGDEYSRGDVFTVFPKDHLEKDNESRYAPGIEENKTGVEDAKIRFLDIYDYFKENNQYKDNLVRELLLIDAASIIQDTLSLTRNSTQLHSENVQRIITDQLLHDNKYVLVDLSENTTVWKGTDPDERESGDKITIIDILTGEKTEIPRSNMDPNRFYWTSKDSLFAFNLMIRDYITETNENHTIFISKDNIPNLVYKNIPPEIFEEGDKKESMAYKSFNEDGKSVSKSMKTSRKKYQNIYTNWIRVKH